MKKLTALMVALMLLISASLTAFAAETAATEAPAPEATMIPNYFAMIKTVDIYGEAFDASVFDGKPFMINVWADWCPPCRSELPALNKLAKQYGDRFTIVGLMPETVKVEGGKLVQLPEKMKAAQDIYADFNISYPSLVPEEILYTILGQIGLKAFPTTLFVDGNGQVLHLIEGAMAEEDWIKTIDDVLKTVDQAGAANDAA